MKKQTAVEWLMEQILPTISITLEDVCINELIDIAKAIEKEQIVDAFDSGIEEWTPIEYSDGQHYYNHNFES
jgi:hypothetical protein